jgi:4'-phosphopantetheinyl transferase
VRWLARGENGMPADDRWLAPGEAARAAQMRYTKRRTEYRLRRWAAKNAVATAASIGSDPAGLARIEVRNRPSGAPYVLLDGSPLAMDVSLTDRAGWAVCLVGPDLGAVGCDLELVEPRTAGFLADFLTPAEREYVGAQPGPDSAHAAANLIWSAKESALKVLRTGLRRDTRTVEVHLDHATDAPGWAPLRVCVDSGAEIPGWWRRDGMFVLTVAAAGPTAHPVALEPDRVLADARPVHSWMERPLAR